MALAKMGIEAVMDVGGFQRGAKAYDAQLAKSSSATTKAASQFDKDLNQIQTKSASVFGKMATIAGGILGAQVIGKALSAVKGFATGAIAAGADATEMISKFGVTFGKETDRMAASLTEFGKATGRSKYDLMTMAADFGAVTKAIGFNEQASADLSLEMAQLAVDVGSFMNVQSPEVMARFRSALTGETESLKTLGIVINQDMIKAEALNTGLVQTSVDLGKVTTAQLAVEAATKRTAAATAKHGANSIEARKAADAQAKAEAKLAESMRGQTGDISQQAKAMAVRNLLMRMTKDAQGDAARTADSWANQMVKLSSTWKDFQTDLGLGLTQGLGPVLQVINRIAGAALPALVTSLNGSVIPAIGKFAETFSLMISGFADAYDSMGGGFTGMLWGVANAIQMLVPQGVSDRIYDLLNSLEKLKGALKFSFASQPTLAGGTAVFMQAIGIPQDIRSRVYKVLDPLEKGIKARLLKIQAAIYLSRGAANTTDRVLAAIGLPPDMTSKVGGVLAKVVEGVDLSGLSAVMGKATAGFQTGGVGGLIGALLGSGGDIATMLGELRQQIITNLFALGNDLLTTLATTFPGLAPIIEGGLKPLLEFGQTLFAAFGALKGEVFSGIMTILPTLFTALGDAVKTITPLIPQLVPMFLGLIAAILPLIVSILPPLVDLFTQVISSILPPLMALLPMIVPPVMALVAAIIPLVAELLPPLISMFMEVVTTVLPPLLALLPAVVTPILGIIEALMPLISSVLPPVIALFTEVINAILPPLLALLPAVITPVIGLVEAFMPLISAILPPLIKLFSELIGLGVEITLLAIEAAAGLVAKVVETVTGWVKKAAESFGGLSISVKKVTDGIGKFGEWLSKIKLPSWLTPGSPTPMENGLWGINAALGPLVDSMLGFARGLSGPAAKAMKDTASAFKDMGKGIGEVAGAMRDLGAYKTSGGAGATAGDFEAWLAQFVEFATMAAKSIDNVVNMMGYDRIHKLRLTSRRMNEIIGAVLVDLSGIKARTLPDLDEWFRQLQDVFYRAVVVMNVIYGKWGLAVIQRAAEVASLVGQVLKILGEDLGAAVPPPPDYAEILDAFVGGLELAMDKIMPKLADIWAFFGGTGLSEAVKTVAAVTEIVGILSLASVMGEIGKAENAISGDFDALLDALLDAMVIAVDKVIPKLQEVQTKWGDVLESVNGVPDSISKVLQILGIDLTKIIPPPSNFVALLTGFLAALVIGVDAIMPKLQEIRTRWTGPVLDEAALTAKALGEIMAVLSLADVFAGLSKPENAIKNNFTKMVQKVLDALTDAVDILIPGLQDINTKWGGVLEEVVKIAQSMASVFGGINDAQTAALEFAKSGNLDLGAFTRKIATLNAATAAAVAGLSVPAAPSVALPPPATGTADSRGGAGAVNVSTGPVVVNIYGMGGNLIQTYTQSTNAAGQVDIRLAENMSAG